MLDVGAWNLFSVDPDRGAERRRRGMFIANRGKKPLAPSGRHVFPVTKKTEHAAPMELSIVCSDLYYKHAAPTVLTGSSHRSPARR